MSAKLEAFASRDPLPAMASALIDDQRTATVDRIRLGVFHLNETVKSRLRYI